MRFSVGIGWIAAVVLSGTAWAGDDIQLTLRAIEFPPAGAEKLMRASKPDERYVAMEKAVDSGVARDLDAIVLSGRVGIQLTSQTGREIIYPTEYTPPESPISVGCKVSTGPKRPYVPGGVLRVEMVTAFETRNAGLAWDVKAMPGGQTGCYSITSTFEYVTQDPDRVFIDFEFYKGSPARMAMPVFRVSRIESPQMIVADGQWVMTGVLDSWRKDAPAGSKVVLWLNVESLNLPK